MQSFYRCTHSSLPCSLRICSHFENRQIKICVNSCRYGLNSYKIQLPSKYFFLNRYSSCRKGSSTVGSTSATATLVSSGFTISQQWLISAGIFAICFSAAILLLLAIPAVIGAAKASKQAELLCNTIKEEAPDTLRTLRLTAMEAADLTNEFSELSNDVTSGLRTTMQTIIQTEQAVLQGTEITKQLVQQAVVPFVKQRVKSSRDIVEHALQQNASLKHDAQHTLESIRKTRVVVKRIRLVVGVTGIAGRVGSGMRAVLNKRKQIMQKKNNIQQQ
eukprot:TRINITY_DN10940_c0_g1_i4.p1 TRINITY_DN10940_c0_g1~~TRINITY_DN10940_c0_g1_i4.p1  ORF type:complete len:275 (+),score=18.00 TRINITY_DN10940_c0_g1_i4:80-904(+)